MSEDIFSIDLKHIEDDEFITNIYECLSKDAHINDSLDTIISDRFLSGKINDIDFISVENVSHVVTDYSKGKMLATEVVVQIVYCNIDSKPEEIHYINFYPSGDVIYSDGETKHF